MDFKSDCIGFCRDSLVLYVVSMDSNYRTIIIKYDNLCIESQTNIAKQSMMVVCVNRFMKKRITKARARRKVDYKSDGSMCKLKSSVDNTYQEHYMKYSNCFANSVNFFSESSIIRGYKSWRALGVRF